MNSVIEHQADIKIEFEYTEHTFTELEFYGKWHLNWMSLFIRVNHMSGAYLPRDGEVVRVTKQSCSGTFLIEIKYHPLRVRPGTLEAAERYLNPPVVVSKPSIGGDQWKTDMMRPIVTNQDSNQDTKLSAYEQWCEDISRKLGYVPQYKHNPIPQQQTSDRGGYIESIRPLKD